MHSAETLEKSGPNTRPGTKLAVVVQIAVGACLVILGCVFRVLLAEKLPYAVLDVPVLSVGLILLLLTVFPARRKHARAFLGVSVSLATVVLGLGLAEVFFRLIRWDFDRSEQAWHALPPFYRQPRTPTGTVFFRRSGPEEWTGQVIRSALLQFGLDASAYQDEPVRTIHYDNLGFRNEQSMTSWNIAVAGDSFTELGFLPYEQLFTTVLARRLNCPVLNLGVSHTGPLTQLDYLEAYGLCDQLRQTVIVFYEGNDLMDLDEESHRLRLFEATGERPLRVFEKQTSLMAALGNWMRRRFTRPSAAVPPTRYDFTWQSRDGEIPVTVSQRPPGRGQVAPGCLEALNHFFTSYRAFGTKHQVRTWLAYMPCKGRVLYHGLRATSSARNAPRVWQPTDLPGMIQEGCATNGIRFIDLTPALVLEAERGELLYNPLMDTHLNARGSEVVGRELALWLSSKD